MRDAYRAELDGIIDVAARMTDLVADAIRGATEALLDADLVGAEQIVAADARIDQMRDDLEHRCFALSATRQPAAEDRRLMVNLIQLACDLERMGDLAAHLAAIARRRYPESPVPVQARPLVAQMGQAAGSLVTKLADAVRGRDVNRAIEAENDAMDALRRRLFSIVVSPEWEHGTRAAVDVTLLGRFYERYADHAVSVARGTALVAVGRANRPAAVHHATG